MEPVLQSKKRVEPPFLKTVPAKSENVVCLFFLVFAFYKKYHFMKNAQHKKSFNNLSL